MDGFEVYKTYLAIKLHFTRDNYNFDQYNGGTRATNDSFNRRNDRFFFHRIAKKYKTDIVDFIVSGFVIDSNTWVGDLSTSTAEQKYLQYVKRRDGFSYYFKLDMMHLLKKADGNFNKIFKCYTKIIEPVSLDEAYLDVTSSHYCEGNANEMAHQIRNKIFNDLKITASAGIASNKFLAKLASEWRKPNGQFSITDEMTKEFIRKLPIRKIIGVGEKTEKECSGLNSGQIILLENLRFYKEETNADESFAKKLSNLAEIYVNDAYGTTHREHASTATMAKFFVLKCPGILLENEITSLKKLMDNPSGPVTAIIGGAKVSSKISVIANMLDVVDNLIIGGGMAYTFIKNNGGAIGDSIFEKDKLNDCSEIISLAEQKNVNVFLPEDVVASNEFSNEGLKKAVNIYNIPKGWQGLDIGPLTISKFEKIVTESKTILWNGPMGVFEMPAFEQGTLAIAKSVAKATSNGAFSLIGGGDSVAAIKKFNLQNEVSFISTGGGAMLESLEGKILPGIKALN